MCLVLRTRGIIFLTLFMFGFSSMKAAEYEPVARSPKDGSVWVATAQEGLLRYGRNGRMLQYGIDGAALCFDAAGRLFVLDCSGNLQQYTDVDGFASVPDIPVPVRGLQASAGAVYALSGQSLYQVSPSMEVLGEVPSTVTGLVSTPEGLWLVSGQEALLWTPEGLVAKPVAVAETVSEPEVASSSEHRHPILLILISVVLGLALGFLIGFLLGRARRKEDAPVPHPVDPVLAKIMAQADKPVEPEIPEEPQVLVNEAPVSHPAESDMEKALRSSDFGRKVWDLVVAHMSDPNYGVESVAADLGITRIHVNRKLKSETGYSPSAVFKFIRMHQASELLLEGRLSVAEIAQKCGFSTPSYFSTAFREYYSVAPSEFVASKSK